MAGEGAAAVDDLEQVRAGRGVGGLRGGRGVRWPGLAVGVVGVGVDAVGAQRLVHAHEGHGERGLGHAVAGQERRGLEAGGREGLDEGAHGVGVDGLGAAAEHAHVREVPAGDLLGAGALGDQRVGEVGGEGDGALVLADGLHPERGVLDEREGRDVHDRHVGRERGEHEADEPHVVVERQPAHALVAAAVGLQPVQDDGLGVGLQAPVGDDHALGRGGGAAGELQEGGVGRLDLRGLLAEVRLAGRDRPLELAGGHELLEGGDLADHAPQQLVDPIARDQHARRGDAEDVDQGLHEGVELAEGERGVERHGHQAGPERGEEAGDELLAVGDHQGHAVARLQAQREQVVRALLHLGAQLAVGPEEVAGGAVGELRLGEGEAAVGHAEGAVEGLDHALALRLSWLLVFPGHLGLSSETRATAACGRCEGARLTARRAARQVGGRAQVPFLSQARRVRP